MAIMINNNCQSKVKIKCSQILWRQIIEMDKRALEEKLRQACCVDDFESAIKLLDSGVDINSKNVLNGWTALHWAAKNSHVSMVSLLLSRGADSSIRTLTGQTAKELTPSLEVAGLLQSNESPPMSPNSRSPTDRLSYELPHNMNNMNRQDYAKNHHSVQDMVIKVRIANSADLDFIEIELPGVGATYQSLLAVCCQELEILPEQVNRIRKLPDTRVRSDADVRRLRSLQELEVVLKEPTALTPHMPPTNIYPSISTNRNQTVLY